MKHVLLTAVCAVMTIASTQAAPNPPNPPLSVPVISQDSSTQNSITIKVAAADTVGAPYGYVLQWRKPGELEFGCDKSYASIPGGGFQLVSLDRQEASLCFDFTCSTDYEFRVFAQAGQNFKRSAFSEVITASTSPCEGQCVYGLGYWKNHPDMWPVTSLQLGDQTYDQAQLMALLQAQPKAAPGPDSPANGMIILAHQLIPALLNEANGADVSVITDALVEAHTLIGSANATTGYLTPDTVSGVVSILDGYNEGEIGPGVCPDLEDEVAQ